MQGLSFNCHLCILLIGEIYFSFAFPPNHEQIQLQHPAKWISDDFGRRPVRVRDVRAGGGSTDHGHFGHLRHDQQHERQLLDAGRRQRGVPHGDGLQHPVQRGRVEHHVFDGGRDRGVAVQCGVVGAPDQSCPRHQCPGHGDAAHRALRAILVFRDECFPEDELSAHDGGFPAQQGDQSGRGQRVFRCRRRQREQQQHPADRLPVPGRHPGVQPHRSARVHRHGPRRQRPVQDRGGQGVGWQGQALGLRDAGQRVGNELGIDGPRAGHDRHAGLHPERRSPASLGRRGFATAVGRVSQLADAGPADQRFHLRLCAGGERHDHERRAVGGRAESRQFPHEHLAGFDVRRP